jgi:hypothetical protein
MKVLQSVLVQFYLLGKKRLLRFEEGCSGIQMNRPECVG